MEQLGVAVGISINEPKESLGNLTDLNSMNPSR